MRKIKIILEVDVDEVNFGGSSIYPLGDGLYDYDLDVCKYQGEEIDFLDVGDACDYLEFLYQEAKPEYGCHG
jgi:hypothetical protein